jgi:hypothetical protein
MSDGAQSLDFKGFLQLREQLDLIAAPLGRKLA